MNLSGLVSGEYHPTDDTRMPPDQSQPQTLLKGSNFTSIDQIGCEFTFQMAPERSAFGASTNRRDVPHRSLQKGF